MSTPFEDDTEHVPDFAVNSEPVFPAGKCDFEAEAADARRDAIMLLEYLKVAIKHLERERGKYRLTPVYLEAAIQNLKQTARDYDFKFKSNLAS